MSRPSRNACTATRGTPRRCASSSMAKTWRSWLCTPPGDSRPMMCRTRSLAIASSQAATSSGLSKKLPLSIAASMRVSSWYTTRPAPMFMWPTSELPICPSGRPTYPPSVWIRVVGRDSHSRRQLGTLAWAMALSRGSSRWPQPSRISRTTGLGRFSASGTSLGPVNNGRCDCSGAGACCCRTSPQRSFAMLRRAFPFPLFFALALAATPAVAAEDISRVNGGIEVAAGEQAGDLSTVNGGIRIGDGAVFKDATTVNGGIRAGSRIQGGELTTVNGGIRLGEQAQVESIATVNGKIEAGPGLRASDDVDSVSGSIFIDRGGRVDGDVSTVSGGIGLVGTEVTGSVETVSGDITVGIGSHVHGDLRVRKSSGGSWIRFGTSRIPRIVIGPDAVVGGTMQFDHEVKLYVHETATTGA